jgi:2-keto-4-pentenoate hydratase/2-oxohepta-3-ene-1,7-dioic acid hydratase in catechol pathway
MRLATFVDPSTGQSQAGEVDGDHIVAFRTGTVQERLAGGDVASADGPSHALADVQLLPPVPRPGAIYCVGLNYAAHAAETGRPLPDPPTIFLKRSACSTPPGGPVRRPPIVQRLDYEGELVVALGADGAIAGYAVADDVSARDLQAREAQWARAKGFDTSCPWGPWITTADEVPDLAGLRLTTRVNGGVRQSSLLADLILGPEAIVGHLAETCTLEPGDIVLTGTPSGVGNAMEPPRLLENGDVVRVEIETLGAIEHRIVAGG